jgi:hypothetical protein
MTNEFGLNLSLGSCAELNIHSLLCDFTIAAIDPNNWFLGFTRVIDNFAGSATASRRLAIPNCD